MNRDNSIHVEQNFPRNTTHSMRNYIHSQVSTESYLCMKNSLMDTDHTRASKKNVNESTVWRSLKILNDERINKTLVQMILREKKYYDENSRVGGEFLKKPCFRAASLRKSIEEGNKLSTDHYLNRIIRFSIISN